MADHDDEMSIWASLPKDQKGQWVETKATHTVAPILLTGAPTLEDPYLPLVVVPLNEVYLLSWLRPYLYELR